MLCVLSTNKLKSSL